MAKKREGKGKSRGMLVTLEPDAAGVDIGAEEIYIAVPVDRDESPVRCFGTFTRDLYEAAEPAHGAKTQIDGSAGELTGFEIRAIA